MASRSSQNLANKLGVKVGDRVSVQATDGHRANADLLVVAVVKPYLAGAAYMEMQALGRALREPGRVSAAYVLMDRSERDALNREVKEIPMIAGVSFLDNASASMRKMLNEGSGFFAYMFIVFSCLMAGGVRLLCRARHVCGTGAGSRDVARARFRAARSVLRAARRNRRAAARRTAGWRCCSARLLSRWLMSQFQTELFTFPYVTSPRPMAAPRCSLLAPCRRGAGGSARRGPAGHGGRAQIERMNGERRTSSGARVACACSGSRPRSWSVARHRGLDAARLRSRSISSQADRGDVRVEVVDEGRTRMHDVYVISAPVTGRVLRVTVEPGDEVAAGAVVARMSRAAAGFLDTRSDLQARAAVNAAEAQLRSAAAELALAEREHQRNMELVASPISSHEPRRIKARRGSMPREPRVMRRRRKSLVRVVR